jgi:hypothetical protein
LSVIFSRAKKRHRAVADDHATAPELRAQILQGQVGRRGDPLEQPVPLARQTRGKE